MRHRHRQLGALKTRLLGRVARCAHAPFLHEPRRGHAAPQFTRPGGRITVGAAPRGTEILFWVADTGAGIAAEDVPHVFDQFWQAKHARRGGAGLGLAIVKGIVEAHGGRVWVESTLGHGSIFFFTIPTPSQPQPQPWRPEEETWSRDSRT